MHRGYKIVVKEEANASAELHRKWHAPASKGTYRQSESDLAPKFRVFCRDLCAQILDFVRFIKKDDAYRQIFELVNLPTNAVVGCYDYSERIRDISTIIEQGPMVSAKGKRDLRTSRRPSRKSVRTFAICSLVPLYAPTSKYPH